MNSALELDGYIAGKYKKLYGTEVDQLKTLKLLYFAQRESLVRDDSLLFSEPMFAFQHGPVCVASGLAQMKKSDNRLL